MTARNPAKPNRTDQKRNCVSLLSSILADISDVISLTASEVIFVGSAAGCGGLRWKTERVFFNAILAENCIALGLVMKSYE